MPYQQPPKSPVNRRFSILIAAVSLLAATCRAGAEDIRVGIIGLDTSHVIHFTKALNDPAAEGDLAICRVVAAYPEGSPDIESSTSRVPKYTEELREMGIEIVPSIEELLTRVDAVLLETNDGRPHLEQVLPVLEAKKRVFIDKPIAGSLTDAIRIFDASERYGVPLFSSSSLRYGVDTQAVRNGSIGKVASCETSGTASLEKTHPDLFWYGIHGVEALFTVMGTGCESVTRSTTGDGMIRVEGKWKGGRIGVFTEGKFGGLAKGEKGESPVGKSAGYLPLLVEIAKYFRTGEIPIQPEETLEIYAFMEAADESKRRGGAEVTLESVMKKARAEAKKSAAATPERQSRHEWPQLKGGAGFTGYSPDDTVRPPLKLLWSYRLDGDASGDAGAGVIVADDKVFVTVANSHSIVALDAHTGRFRWEHRNPGIGQIGYLGNAPVPAWHGGRITSPGALNSTPCPGRMANRSGLSTTNSRAPGAARP